MKLSIGRNQWKWGGEKQEKRTKKIEAYKAKEEKEIFTDAELIRMIVDIKSDRKWTKRFIDRFISCTSLCHNLYHLGREEIWLWLSLEATFSGLDKTEIDRSNTLDPGKQQSSAVMMSCRADRVPAIQYCRPFLSQTPL